MEGLDIGEFVRIIATGELALLLAYFRREPETALVHMRRTDDMREVPLSALAGLTDKSGG
jgi:hypothetical protein